MSKHKHNYTQYSDKKRSTGGEATSVTSVFEVKMDSIPEVTDVNLAESHNDPVGEPGPAGAVGVRPEIMSESVETKPLPAMVEGIVAGCAKLNVRAEANLFADIVCVLDASSEIEIDVNKSNNDWFYICTATGIEGYCMRKFVEAHL